MRAVRSRLPAARAAHVTGSQREWLCNPRAPSGLHGVRRVPARVSRFLFRDLPIRDTGCARNRGDVVTRALLEGSEAIARAALAAGCRFFAGYPMTPFTELLEHFAALLPESG